MGRVLHDQGDLKEALQYYQKALAIQEQDAPNSLNTASLHDNIGRALYNQGDIKVALEYSQKALMMQEWGT